MMAGAEKISRLSRLTSILLKLQSNSFVTVKALADHFQVSSRTIYRDLIALEEAGVPLVSEEGRGYSLIEGYNIPPVMFTEAEANALIMAEKMMEKTKDDSLIAHFNSAVAKIKSVLDNSEKEKSNLLAERTIIGKNWNYSRTSSFLSQIQTALTNFQLVKIHYLKKGDAKSQVRTIEPFAIYHNTSENWVAIAWCRLRNDFRNFRIDRIERLETLKETFSPHKISLDEYVEIQRKKHFGEENGER